MDQDEKYIERFKVIFEYLKHITTLSVGAIVLVATFLEKVFNPVIWKNAIIVSISGFMLAILASILVYSVMLPTAFQKEDPSDVKKVTAVLGMICTWVGFLVGMGALFVFTVRNLLV